MKKTLIALAALAAFGTASAQSTVTISGNLAAGFAGDTTSAGVKTGGYGFDTTNITLSVVEDLGGGLTAYGSMSIENFQEDVATNGNGVTLGLRGGFGSVAFSSAEGSDFLPVDGLTASSDSSDADRITYTTPTMSGCTFALTHQDAIDGGTVVSSTMSSIAALHPAEIDADARGVSSVLTGSVNYTVGPVAIDALHADFQGSTIASRTGVRGAYDFGMAKITYGMMKQKNVASGTDVTETGLTVAAPLGPVTASYSYATSKTEGGTGLTKKGNALTVSYALSKRSSLALYSEEHDHPGSAALSASKTKEYSLLLKHSF